MNEEWIQNPRQTNILQPSQNFFLAFFFCKQQIQLPRVWTSTIVLLNMKGMKRVTIGRKISFPYKLGH